MKSGYCLSIVPLLLSSHSGRPCDAHEVFEGARLTPMSANPSAPANPYVRRCTRVASRDSRRTRHRSKSNHHPFHAPPPVNCQLTSTTTTITHLPPKLPTCPNCANEKTRRHQVPMPRPVRTLPPPPPRPLVSNNRTTGTGGISMRPPSKSCGRSVRRSSVGSSSSLVCPQ